MMAASGRRLWAPFVVADFIVAIFGLAMAIRLKICMLDVERADRGA